MKNLITIDIKRLFTFGCSFTDYLWPTWANILGYEFREAEFYNFGKSGAGNHYIFNMLMQADAVYNFTHEDLIIVQWTNVGREDRYFHPGSKVFEAGSDRDRGGWVTPGNIYSQGTYDQEWIEKYFSEYGALVRDLAFIKAASEMLRHKAQWHFLQMNELIHYVNQWDDSLKVEPDKHTSKVFGKNLRVDQLRDIYKETISNLKPSFYSVLYNNNWTKKFKADRKLVNKNFQDGHPHPLEHYDYLKRTFNHNWSPSTNEKVGDIQKKWIKLMNNVSHNDSKFSVYGQSDRWLKMTKYALEMRHGQNIDFRTHR